MDSIINQNYKNIEIIFVDNNSSDNSLDIVTNNYPSVLCIENKTNAGYSAGANSGIRLSHGKYVIIANVDILFTGDCVGNMVALAEKEDDIGAISGKLLKYDFRDNKPTDMIDSVGIVAFKNRRIIDKGQNEEDAGQYDTVQRVFGASGAAAFYRRSALERVKIGDEYFDEDFFAYKEDVDISWRLQLYGWKCMYTPAAVVYHGRAVSGTGKRNIILFIKNRRSQSKSIRQLSFRNHHLMMVKDEDWEIFKKHFWRISVREVSLLVYLLFFEFSTLSAVGSFFHCLNKAKAKRKVIMENIKISEQEIDDLFI